MLGLRIMAALAFSVISVHSCPKFATGPFATHYHKQWSWLEATDKCTEDFIVKDAGMAHTWSGAFCTMPTGVEQQKDRATLTDIFITRRHCVNKCNLLFPNDEHTIISCDHASDSKDSIRPEDIKVICQCAELGATQAATMLEIHDEYVSNCATGGPLATCQPISTDGFDFELVPNSNGYKLADNSYIPPTVLTAKCTDKSMQPSADSVIITSCQASGVWDAQLNVTCVPVCHSLDDLDIVGEAADSVWTYSEATLGGFYGVGTNATKNCMDTYALATDHNSTLITMTCGADGWTPDAPHCVSVAASRCDLLETDASVNRTVDSSLPVDGYHKIGDVIKIECDSPDDVLEAGKPNQAACTATGQWSPVDLVSTKCVARVVCPSITFSEGVNATFSMYEDVDYSPGSSVVIKCNGDDHHLSPNIAFATCHQDGTWSSQLETVSCMENSACDGPNLPAIITGFVDQQFPLTDYPSIANNATTYMPGTIITATCVDKSTPSLNNTSFAHLYSICLSNGKWSASLEDTQCASTCPKFVDGSSLPNVDAGQTWTYAPAQESNLVNDGTTAQIACANGTKSLSTDETSVKLTCSNGKWSTDSCAFACKVPGAMSGISFSEAAESNVVSGTQLVLSCTDQAQTLIGANTTSTCLESGEWSKDVANTACVTSCAPLTAHPVNTKHDDNTTWTYTENIGDVHPIDAVATINCADGFTTEEDAAVIEATCTTTGWNLTATYCAKKQPDCSADTRLVLYRSVDFGIQDEFKPENIVVESVSEERECLDACRENRMPLGTAHCPCKSAEYNTAEQSCTLYSELPPIQLDEGDGTSNETIQNKGVARLAPTNNTVLFEKDCVTERVYNAVLCAEDVIEKFPYRETWEYAYKPADRETWINQNWTVAECLDACVKHNENPSRTTTCQYISYENRYSYTSGVPLEGYTLSMRTDSYVKYKKIGDVSYCLLATQVDNEPNAGTHDLYYDVRDKELWRPRRWMSIMLEPECSKFKMCPTPVMPPTVVDLYHRISDRSLDFDKEFYPGTTIKFYCANDRDVSGINEQNDTMTCNGDGQWSVDASNVTCAQNYVEGACLLLDIGVVNAAPDAEWTYDIGSIEYPALVNIDKATPGIRAESYGYMQCAAEHVSSVDEHRDQQETGQVKVQCKAKGDGAVWSEVGECVKCIPNRPFEAGANKCPNDTATGFPIPQTHLYLAYVNSRYLTYATLNNIIHKPISSYYSDGMNMTYYPWPLIGSKCSCVTAQQTDVPAALVSACRSTYFDGENCLLYDKPFMKCGIYGMYTEAEYKVNTTEIRPMITETVCLPKHLVESLNQNTIELHHGLFYQIADGDSNKISKNSGVYSIEACVMKCLEHNDGNLTPRCGQVQWNIDLKTCELLVTIEDVVPTVTRGEDFWYVTGFVPVL